MRLCMCCCSLILVLAGTAMAQGIVGISPERCGELAAQIEQQCGDEGGSPELCGELRARFEMLCVEVPPPPPPPPPGCREKCWKRAQEAYQGCLEENPDNPLLCRQQMMTAYEGCVAECGEPPPPPPGCRDQCKIEADEAYRACKAGAGQGPGDGPSERECQRLYQQRLEACLAECEPPPPPPPAGGCHRECLRRAEEAKAQCRADGAEPERCQAIYQSVLRECSRRCNDNELPPPPTGCGARCVEEARVAVAECIEGGGDPEGCWATARETLKVCLEGCEHVPPFPCREECRIDAAETYEACAATIDEVALRDACIAEGVEGDEALAACVEAKIAEALTACEAEAKAQLEACLAECGPVPPEPPTCEERCELHAEQYYDACIARGGEPGECQEDALDLSERCLERCEYMPPPSCAGSCAEEARRIFEECLTPVEGEPDPDPAECKQAAMEFLESCRLACEHPEPPGCEVRCDNLADRIERECIEAGIDPETCASKAADARAACVAGCPPQPKPCPERCEWRVRVFQRMCEAMGGDPEQCALRAGQLLEKCQEQCDKPRPRPCVAECVAEAKELYSACIEDGGSCKDCREQALALLKECAAECPPRPEPCREQCAMAAREQLAGCLDAIDESQLRDECAAEGVEEPELDACVALKKAAAEEACRIQVNEQLAGCLAQCRQNPPPPEPPTCEERCDAAAERVREACMKMQGEDDDPAECDETAAQFLQRCQARCGDPAPPKPCDVDCGALAARIQAACAEEGGTEWDCAEKAEEFRLRCQARVDEHCKVMGLVRNAAPKAFRRGDSNDDGDIDIADAVHTLRGIFCGDPILGCDDALDANDDGQIDIADGVRVLIYLFKTGEALPPPMGDEGHDESPDALICE